MHPQVLAKNPTIDLLEVFCDIYFEDGVAVAVCNMIFEHIIYMYFGRDPVRHFAVFIAEHHSDYLTMV